MTKKNKLFLALLYVLACAPVVFADGLDTISGASLETSIGKIVKWIAGLAAVIFGAFGFIQAGMAYTQGDEGVAMKKFKNTAIGVVIILGCWAIAKYVISFIG